MRKKAKNTLIIVTIFILLIGAGVIYYIYPFFKYSSHIYNTYHSVLSEDACYEYPVRYSKEGWFLIDCVINDTTKIPLRIDTQATNLMRSDSIHAYGGKYWGDIPFESTNAYQRKDNIDLYTLPSISFGAVKIKDPIFKSIGKENIIYDIIDEGVFGTEMLAVGIWAFDTEKGMITLFNSNNHERLVKSTAGMTYFPQGLREESIPVYIDGINEEVRFTLDLGYSGTLEISNALASRLKTHYPYEEKIKQHGAELTDTLTTFKIPVTIAGTQIDSCEIVNSRIVNANYIGAKFMHRCNFVLHYSLKEHGRKQKELYLRVR